ncbi:MAG TPA: Clp protease N-terminal domain-containing protein [Candidatus Dormibacteraeota bacterium]|jgi:ATP-dependent Clp protease ATP-binding subunit ClpC|nr:Clp protease N-terminal domain-containing protein [Candidatus Dormibacteraeota bacterium]
MHPFDHFSDATKKVLELAQEEAVRSHHSYIGTEHLLLGLLREGDGIGAQALRDLGVDVGRVREALARVLGRNERIIIQQIIPTSRVKKVIEISFDEAQRMGSTEVDTEHILLGLMVEGEGVAVKVLEDLGATQDRVTRRVAELRRTRVEGQAPTRTETAPPPLLFSLELEQVLERARELARDAGARLVTPDHLRHALGEGGGA